MAIPIRTFYFCPLMPEEAYRFNFKDEELFLLPSKAIWFPNQQALLVSDTHLGKSAHFRKAGIAIPNALAQEDLSHLSDLLFHYKPKTLIFLGDLFHSDSNKDCEWFFLWREMHHHVDMVLVKGNHDILPPSFYEHADLLVVKEMLFGTFKLMHDPPKSSQEYYVLSGHIHPGVRLQGKARQGITLPCFYFGTHYGVLPAFGKFTGKAILKIKEGDHVFVITGDKIKEIGL